MSIAKPYHLNILLVATFFRCKKGLRDLIVPPNKLIVLGDFQVLTP
jgi:hypothetical protein